MLALGCEAAPRQSTVFNQIYHLPRITTATQPSASKLARHRSVRLLLLMQQSFMQSALFPTPQDLYLGHTKQHLPSKKVFKMSNSMGIASAFVLSSLLLSPFAMAEESPAFVAHNAARAAAFDKAQAELTAKAQKSEKTRQTSASQAQPQVEKDS